MGVGNVSEPRSRSFEDRPHTVPQSSREEFDLNRQQHGGWPRGFDHMENGSHPAIAHRHQMEAMLGEAEGTPSSQPRSCLTCDTVSISPWHHMGNASHPASAHRHRTAAMLGETEGTPSSQPRSCLTSDTVPISPWHHMENASHPASAHRHQMVAMLGETEGTPSSQPRSCMTGDTVSVSPWRASIIDDSDPFGPHMSGSPSTYCTPSQMTHAALLASYGQARPGSTFNGSSGYGVHVGSSSQFWPSNCPGGRMHQPALGSDQPLLGSDEARRSAWRQTPPAVSGPMAPTPFRDSLPNSVAGSPSPTISPGNVSSMDESGSGSKKSPAHTPLKGKGRGGKRTNDKNAGGIGNGKAAAGSKVDGDDDGTDVDGGVGAQEEVPTAAPEGGAVGAQSGAQPHVVWNVEEQLLLVRCKIDYDLEESHGRSSVKRFKSKDTVWSKVTALMAERGVVKEQYACSQKWDTLMSHMRRVRDHHRKSGAEDYFTMTTKVRKMKKLDFCMQRPVYDLMSPTRKIRLKATASAFSSVREAQKENTTMIVGVMDMMNSTIEANGTALFGAVALIAQAFMTTASAPEATSSAPSRGST
ncbi:hypothetical protein CBR_g47120 [Chara braunii]|uniref:Myb/SANT-like DNA-binding domain-containing protein n=1 Tax=Chara braunii TaxID=69332 RepID=A0A388M1J6_CHABU|nr:hypothetical protein CBR_g47120 [Chara braunii]|eukprot:GBG88421.1 hypothetical protein CBR_g47120 [Chara braunii]